MKTIQAFLPIVDYVMNIEIRFPLQAASIAHGYKAIVGRQRWRPIELIIAIMLSCVPNEMHTPYGKTRSPRVTSDSRRSTYS